MTTLSDPSIDLQIAIFAALSADSDLAALVSDRIYDGLPQDVEYPCINLGESQVLGDDTQDCGDGSEIFFRNHVWTKEQGFEVSKQIVAQVRRVLKTVPTLTGYTVGVVEFVQTQFMRDPEWPKCHAVIEHRYLITHDI